MASPAGLGVERTGLSGLGANPPGSAGSFPGFGGGGSSLGLGLRPQMTGSGAANPFRASMVGSPTGGGQGFGGAPQFMNATSPPAFGGSMGGPPTNGATPSFGANLFGGPSGAFGSNFNSVGGHDVSRQQQNGSASLI